MFHEISARSLRPCYTAHDFRARTPNVGTAFLSHVAFPMIPATRAGHKTCSGCLHIQSRRRTPSISPHNLLFIGYLRSAHPLFASCSDPVNFGSGHRDTPRHIVHSYCPALFFFVSCALALSNGDRRDQRRGGRARHPRRPGCVSHAHGAKAKLAVVFVI